MNDFTVTDIENSAYVRITSGSSLNITGVDSSAFGSKSEICFIIDTSQTITFAHASAGSTAANRLLMPGASDLVPSQYSCVTLVYDTTNSRWLCKSIS